MGRIVNLKLNSIADVNAVIDHFCSGDLRMIDSLFYQCIALKDQEARLMNERFILFINDNDIAFRNLIIEILKETIGYSPELIEANYDNTSESYRINIISLTINTKDLVIKDFLMRRVGTESCSNIRSAMYESLCNYNDDIKVLELLIERFYKESDLSPFIVQLLAKFDYPICTGFLFSLLKETKDEMLIMTIVYAFSHLTCDKAIIEYLSNNIFSYSQHLRPYFLKAIVKIADNNSLEIPKKNDLKLMADSVLDVDDNEDIYALLRLNEESIYHLKTEFLGKVLMSKDKKNIALLVDVSLKSSNVMFFYGLLLHYFKKETNPYNFRELINIIYDLYHHDKVMIKEIKTIVEHSLTAMPCVSEESIKELLEYL